MLYSVMSWPRIPAGIVVVALQGAAFSSLWTLWFTQDVQVCVAMLVQYTDLDVANDQLKLPALSSYSGKQVGAFQQAACKVPIQALLDCM